MNLQVLKGLKIGYKILILFQFMMIPTIIIFASMMIVTSKMNEFQNRILLENVTSISAAYNLEKSVFSMRGLKANYMLNGDKSWINEFDNNVEAFNFWYGELFNLAFTEEERNILSELSIDFSNYNSYHRKIISLVNNGNKSGAIDLLLNESADSYNAIIDKSEQLINKNWMLITEIKEQIEKYIVRSRYLTYTIITFFLFFGIVLVILVTKSITGPIREIVRDIHAVLPDSSDKNEMELLKERFTSMIDTLKANQKKLIVSERRAAIGEIAAGISHELNNPIGIICGFADLLMNKTDFTEEDREIVNDIYSEAQRCKKLLKELLDFARTPEPCFIETDLMTIVDETLNLFKNQEKYRDIKLLYFKTGEEAKVFIDPFQIKQTLINLLLNSCDAVNYNGNIQLMVDATDNNVRIFLRDNGKGIKKENLDKIFTPFFTTKTDGIGLGLAICRDIVEKHHGVINVNSEPGNGTEFIITLPGGAHESQ